MTLDDQVKRLRESAGPYAVVIDYTNHRGERRERRILPQLNALFFDSTEFHREKQWLMVGFDLEKGETRTFALKDIHSWRPA